MGVAGVSNLTSLVAEDARPHARALALSQLGPEVRIGDLRPRHLDGIADPLTERPFGLVSIHDGPLRHHRHLGRQSIPQEAHEVQVEARCHVAVRTGGRGGEDGPPYDGDVVDEWCQPDGDLDGFLGHEAGPWRQLVT